MTRANVSIERRDRVAIVTLQRPEARNALSMALAKDLLECLEELRDDEQIGAVVLSGAGGHFCAGGDIRAVGNNDRRTTEQRLAALRTYHQICRVLQGYERPIVAAVDGVAFGAGFSLALLCDVVLVTPRTRMCMVFHKMGRIPDMAALYTLPRAVGTLKAKELILTAREVGGEEARQLGIATELVDPERLSDRALEMAAALSEGPSIATGISKQILNQSLSIGFETLLQLELTGQAAATSSEFAQEAVRRFLAKEPPQFHWPQPRSQAK